MSKSFDSDICPIPESEYSSVLLAHGGGGRLTHELIDRMFAPAFQSPDSEVTHDGAVVSLSTQKLAFTTDSYVVRPLFFPGGDIGSLAVNGTVNDLAMCGAEPSVMSVGFILEEGLSTKTLWRVVLSMRKAARTAGIQIVTGDTKVVEHGKCDGMYISTSGIGLIRHHLDIRPTRIKPGDSIVLSGDIGRHGIAVMAEREGLSFEDKVESDCAPLASAVQDLLASGVEIHCLRDLTRGGFATALAEIATAASVQIVIEENTIPVTGSVRGACELLGLDPMYVANEGRFVAFVPRRSAPVTIEVLRRHSLDSEPCVIGSVMATRARGLVILQTAIGTRRVIDMLSGEQLPRIC